MLKDTILIMEEANMPPREFPWDEMIVKQFRFDQGDIENLEAMYTIWKGDTAFSWRIRRWQDH